MAHQPMALPASSVTRFGDFLKYLRRRAQLTQSDVAIAVGYSTMQISRLEQNKRRPDLATIMALFVPALHLEEEPELVARLLELAAEARGEALLVGNKVSSKEAVHLPAPGQTQYQVTAGALHISRPPDVETAPDHIVNLPAPLTSLIGRAEEVAAVCIALERDATRLLTLTGPPGIGKTRLSIQVATEMGPVFPSGVVFVALAAIREPELVLAAIARALRVQQGQGQSLFEGVKSFLQGRRLLLVLDNFEQVLDAGTLVGELLEVAAGLKVVVSSRVLLHIYGEHEYPVPPLALPRLDWGVSAAERTATIAGAEAVRLFIERAQAVDLGFARKASLSDANLAAIAMNCHRLDGLPLAIELAAGRSKSLSPQELLVRLSSRLDVLTSGPRNHPARQQTLRGAIDWSYQLLDQHEQALFRRLAVFSGGCDVDAVAAICDQSEDEARARLLSLRDKSLLLRETVPRPEASGTGAPRFTMLETICEYAFERLLDHGEVDARRRHAEYFLRLAERAEPELVGAEQAVWVARLEAELDNVRAALGWLGDAGEIASGLRLAGALWRFWYVRGYLSEGRSWLESLLATSAHEIPTAIRAKAATGAGIMAAEQGDFGRAAALAEVCLRLYQELGDWAGIAGAQTLLGSVLLRQGEYAPATVAFESCLAVRHALGEQRGIAAALNNLGLVAREQGQYIQASDLYERSLAIKRDLGDRRGIALALNNLGDVALDRRDYDRAAALFEESLALFRDMGEKWGIALLLTNLGTVARHQGTYESARTLYLEGLALYQNMDTKPDASECLEGLASVTFAQGQTVRATRLFAAAAHLRQAIGAPLSPVARAEYDRTLAAVRAAAGESTFAAAWNDGRAMSLEQAVAFAGISGE